MQNSIKSSKTFIIAEIGNNHEGNIKIAKKLIREAFKAGANAVKFQTIDPSKLVHQKQKKRIKQLKKFYFNFDKYLELKRYSEKLNLDFLSTPFDIESARFLCNHCDIIKVSSGDNDFFMMIEEILKFKKKIIIISTGMSNESHIKKILFFLKKKISNKEIKKRVYFLHCVSSYPVPENEANLLSIKYLKEKFNLNIGYSDHTLGFEACISAVSLGAKIIEKHFTLNKNFSSFRDHKLSADPDELSLIVKSIRKIELMLGRYEKKISISEKKNLISMKRSPYSTCKIEKGKFIKKKDIIYLRPRSRQGLNSYNHIFKYKTIRAIKPNSLIKKAHLKT
jgi:N,N'-diacetyllegionaminate synthase